MDLSIPKYQSRVLMSWLEGRDGGIARAGVERPAIQAMLPENGSITDLSAEQLANLLGAMSTTAAGVAVTAESALKVTTVYGCVNLISGAIASCGAPVYERTEKARKQVDHDYWWLFNERACDGFTSAIAAQYFIAARLFYGDGFARLLRPNNFTNRITGWQPYHPQRVEPFLNSQNALRYRCTNRDGTAEIVNPEDMLHVPSLGFDGLRSPSPITYAAREAIGSSLAAEEYSARFFSQGSTHDIAITHPRKMEKEQIDALRASYLARYGGSRNNRSPLILTGGLSAEKLSITPVDADLIESRRFTVEEICRVFGVPPFMVGSTDKTTSWGSGVEHMGIGFVKYTLRPHLVAIQQELNAKLWPNRERFFIEYDTADLERGDFKTRMEGFRIALGRAGELNWVNVNEVRDQLNLEPVTGGDRFYDRSEKPESKTESGDTDESKAAAAAE
jgi:HK97 family phage portal protein